MCVPLWGKQYPDKYYGAYCTDIMPASKSNHFLNSYFKDDDIKDYWDDFPVNYDYLIMNDFKIPEKGSDEVSDFNKTEFV